MMTRAFAIACLCLFASPAAAQEAAAAAAADPDGVVREILELSGQKQQLKELVVRSQDQATKAGKTLTPQQSKRFQAALSKAFRFETLYQTVFEHHRSVYDAKRATALLEWLRGPLGRRIIAQELKAFSAQAPTKPQTRQLPATREALIERVQEASRALELTRRTVATMVRSTAPVINASQPADKRESPDNLEAAISRLLYTADPGLRQLVRIWVQHTYRDVPDEDLRAYFQFLDSELGRWYVQVGIEANVKAIEVAGKTIGEEMGKVIEEKKEEEKKTKRKKRRR